MKKAIHVFLAVLLLPAAALSAEMDGKFSRHYADSHFKVTTKGLYSVEMLIMGKELKVGANSVDIIVHDMNDAEVMGAELSVTPWMPDMGHGVGEKAVVKERGGGLYSVENIILIMGGRWELRVSVKKGDQEDSAFFDFPDVASGKAQRPEHTPMASKMPPGVKPSRFATSNDGHFRATFISDIEPIPQNRVHGWKLYVETAEGAPVEDASISVSGVMPEHGHGMPTKPQVDRNLGGGVYAVQGLKFQMPGWWKVELDISSGGRKDKATFNLMLR